MYKALIISILQIITVNSIVYSECALCEDIKEKNLNLPPLKHIYYEDYLEELRAEESSSSETIDFEEDLDKKKAENVTDNEY